MYHYRKTRRTYRKLNAGDKVHTICNFCSEKVQAEALSHNDTMYVVSNRVKYDMFEGMKVIDHLMVIPKEHHETMGTFSDDEKIDAMNIISDYEARGYNVFARAVGSVARSKKHQHTHLIKLDDKPSKVIIFSQKPYILIDF
ncbi:hypothetical protein D9M68_782810 [compost metagenome]